MPKAPTVFGLLAAISVTIHAQIWTGMVADSADGSPLSEASVSVYATPANPPAVDNRTTTGSDGNFSLTKAITALHRVPAWQHRVQMRNGVISWDGGGPVAITVFDIQGKERAKFVSGSRSEVSSYSVPNLPKGNYRVKFDAEGLTQVFSLVNMKNGSTNRFATLSASHSLESSGLAKTAGTPMTILMFTKNGYATKFLTVSGGANALQVRMRKAAMDPGSPGLPPMPDDVKHQNTYVMFGPVSGVAMPLKWRGTVYNYNRDTIAARAKDLADLYFTLSRHKVQLVGRDGGPGGFTAIAPEDCEVPFDKSSKNEDAADAYLIAKHNIPDAVLKWFFTDSTSNPHAGSNIMHTWGPRALPTSAHELGHLFRLGHAKVLVYKSDGTYDKTVEYGDRTSTMGAVNSTIGFNLPNYHRLNWIAEDEVAVFKKENSGTVYRIRNLLNHPATEPPLAGVVYYMPVTGNRLWISVNERKSFGNDYLGNGMTLTKYVTGWHATPEMLPTVCIKQLAAGHTDEFGLTYEVVAVDPNKAWADIRITYNPSKEIANKPLVFTPTFKTVASMSASSAGKMEVTIKVTNPNPPTTAPCIQQFDKLTVPNAARVALKGEDLPLVIPGGTSAQVVYTVESKKGAPESPNGRLRGEFQFAHLYPFTFDINFQ